MKRKIRLLRFVVEMDVYFEAMPISDFAMLVQPLSKDLRNEQVV
jgi:hypothetical protein